VRDKPTFDEIEPAQVETSPLNGLTDAQWVARRERKERNFRIVCGLVFGGLVGLVASWHVGFLGGRSHPGAWLVTGGSMALFAALFGQRRDREALRHARWILFPEWSLVERLPLWAIALVWALALALIFTLATVAVIGRFPHFG
jgi:hypothetical protein